MPPAKDQLYASGYRKTPSGSGHLRLVCGGGPHTLLLVATDQPGVRAPQGYAKDNRLTLNMSPKAVDGLELGRERVRFSARFGGASHQVEVPLRAIVAIFSAETHDGLIFGDPPPAAQNGDARQDDTHAPALETVPEMTPQAADRTHTPEKTPETADTQEQADEEVRVSHLRLVE
ncbi:MAG: stringent starvation protein B [Leptospirillia bacterium]